METQALKAAAHNYPGVAVTYWDEIFEVVAQVINSGLESRSGTVVDAAHFNVPSTFASSVSSPDIVQTPRNADDKQLAHTAIEVCNLNKPLFNFVTDTRAESYLGVEIVVSLLLSVNRIGLVVLINSPTKLFNNF